MSWSRWPWRRCGMACRGSLTLTVSARLCFANSKSNLLLRQFVTPTEGYRSNVGLCLSNPSKKIFGASRLDVPESWQMPQGGIDEGEDPRQVAIRELREDTGVTSARVVDPFPHWSGVDTLLTLQYMRAVEFKKPIYKEVFSVFSPHLQ